MMNEQRWEVAVTYSNRDGGHEAICILVSASTIQLAMVKTMQYCRDAGGAYIHINDVSQLKITDIVE